MTGIWSPALTAALVVGVEGSDALCAPAER